ncbi:MAG: hypothetical protein KAU17_09090 [Spirochaetales bacterium]|nr:hypothetical protein [Spirochaetales bacterium]
MMKYILLTRQRIFLLIILSIVFSQGGCGSHADLFPDWQGTWIGTDRLGELSYGCRTYLIDGCRYLDLWYIDFSSGISYKTYELTEFEIVDLYGKNYGTAKPTWVYLYSASLKEGSPYTREDPSLSGTAVTLVFGEMTYQRIQDPIFIIEEFYDGSYIPRLFLGMSFYLPGDVFPFEPFCDLQKVPEPVGISHFPTKTGSGEDVPEFLTDSRGKYFDIAGIIDRCETRKRLPTPGFSKLFQLEIEVRVFLEPAELEDVRIIPEVFFSFSPKGQEDQVQLPHHLQPGEDIAFFGRFESYRKTNSEDGKPTYIVRFQLGNLVDR